MFVKGSDIYARSSWCVNMSEMWLEFLTSSIRAFFFVDISLGRTCRAVFTMSISCEHLNTKSKSQFGFFCEKWERRTRVNEPIMSFALETSYSCLIWSFCCSCSNKKNVSFIKAKKKTNRKRKNWLNKKKENLMLRKKCLKIGVTCGLSYGTGCYFDLPFWYRL